MNVHVPVSSHEKLMAAVAKSGPVTIKIDLTGTPQDKIYVTSTQVKKMEEAVAKGRKSMSIRFSARQARHNINAEGGFLSGILSAAVRYLPAIVAGLAAGADEYHKSGNGMFLGRRNNTYQIEKAEGDGILVTPVEHTKLRGFYVKHNGTVYKGKGLLHGLFGQIPILNLLF